MGPQHKDLLIPKPSQALKASSVLFSEDRVLFSEDRVAVVSCCDISHEYRPQVMLVSVPLASVTVKPRFQWFNTLEVYLSLM